MSVIHDIGKTERSEMYLKAMLMIAHENPPVTVTKVAEFLGVSPASVSEMVRRMESNDLVTHSSSGIALTSMGLKHARRLVRRMRLAERLLSDILGMPLPEVYEEACRLEHVISDAVEERIAAVLGDPETCPHGHPIPSVAGRFGRRCCLIRTLERHFYLGCMYASMLTRCSTLKSNAPVLGKNAQDSGRPRRVSRGRAALVDRRGRAHSPASQKPGCETDRPGAASLYSQWFAPQDPPG